MNGELYRLLLVVVLLTGLVPGVTYLWLYGRPIKRWWSRASRDASGWVAIVCLLYLWSLFRAATTWIRSPEVPNQPISAAIVALLIGAALSYAVLRRLQTYLKFLRNEQLHPTITCPTCGGSGVISAEVKG